MPSHIGIKGITKADKLAHDTPIYSTLVFPIPSSNALPTLQNYIRTVFIPDIAGVEIPPPQKF